jgi:excisionase family DNA binding protein
MGASPPDLAVEGGRDRWTNRKARAMVDDDLLTPAEVGRLFRVNPKTVTRWAITGKIKAVRTLGGHRRFYRSEIERAIQSARESEARAAF